MLCAMNSSLRCASARSVLGLGLAMLTVQVSAAPQAADAAAGKDIFEAHCRMCHARGAAALTRPVEAIPQMLRSSPVHRARFELSERELQDLLAYVAAVRSGS